MGAFKKIEMEIQELLSDGYDTVTVSNRLNVPLQWCEDLADALWDDAEPSEEDDGQPTEYQEWQDVYGGDDWDHGQYEAEY